MVEILRLPVLLVRLVNILPSLCYRLVLISATVAEITFKESSGGVKPCKLKALLTMFIYAAPPRWLLHSPFEPPLSTSEVDSTLLLFEVDMRDTQISAPSESTRR